jgi:hypothetical protein
MIDDPLQACERDRPSEVILPEIETPEHAHDLPARMKPEQLVTRSSSTARSDLASRRQRSPEHAT